MVEMTLSKKQLKEIAKDDSVEICTEMCTNCIHGGFLCRRFIYVAEERKMAAETALLCVARRKEKGERNKPPYKQISLFDTAMQ